VLKPRGNGALTGKMLSFNQGEFTAPHQPIDVSMDDTGFAYVPAACSAQEPCRLHIALHGCLQSVSNLGQDFVKHAGYNEWADTNHIIVLYPQTQSLGLTNPQACWDWWGYLDADPTVSPTYLLKSGKQISAIKGMIDRLTTGVSAPPDPAPSTATATAPATVLSPDHTDIAIDLIWSSVAGVANYDVFRASGGSPSFQKIATVGGLSYADTGLKPRTQYRYKVRAVSAAGFSPIVTQTTLPLVPPCDDPGQCAIVDTVSTPGPVAVLPKRQAAKGRPH
jgi:hypothetical protein